MHLPRLALSALLLTALAVPAGAGAAVVVPERDVLIVDTCDPAQWEGLYSEEEVEVLEDECDRYDRAYTRLARLAQQGDRRAAQAQRQAERACSRETDATKKTRCMQRAAAKAARVITQVNRQIAQRHGQAVRQWTRTLTEQGILGSEDEDEEFDEEPEEDFR